MHGFGAEVFIEEVRKCNDMMILVPTIKHLTYFLQNIRQIRRDVFVFLLTSSQKRHQIYAYIRRLPCI